MKRFLAIMLAAMLVLCSSLTAFAEFTINEYWNIGQVANLVNDNGANTINITLTEDAVWQVTGTSLISSLTIRDQAQVVIPAGIVLTVGGTAYTDCVLTAESLEARPSAI